MILIGFRVCLKHFLVPKSIYFYIFKTFPEILFVLQMYLRTVGVIENPQKVRKNNQRTKV